ncbi:hypothetical protein BDQ17DRAFT_1249469, partial [Cyathus striatus]
LKGAQLFAYMTNWMFYGVLCVQVYLYYLAFPKDPLHNKIMVYIVFILETIQSAMLGRDAYVTFAEGFGNPNAVNNIHLEWFTLPFLGSIGKFSCCFYWPYVWREITKI